MTTQTTMDAIISELRERLIDARTESAESSKIAYNSYGAGYDAGYAQAIRDTIAGITGEETV